MAKEETIDYDKFTLDPTKDVLVPMQLYVALVNIIQEVEKKHAKVERTDKMALFNRATHEKLSKKGAHAIKDKDREKDFYENIDMDATAASAEVKRDELGFAALRVMGEFRGVFKHNIDKGNRIAKADTAPVKAPLSVVEDQPVTKSES